MEVRDRRDSPPLWLQLPASATMLHQRPPAAWNFNNSITLIILIPLLLLLVISSILSFVSHTCQSFRNNIVKNGWDLLNIVLVLFAILCGVIGKLYEDETQVITSEVAVHTSMVTTNKETCCFANFDEFDLAINNPPTSQSVQSGVNEVESDDCKVIPVDTCVLGPPRSSTKAPLPPSNPAKLRPRRSPKSVLQAKKQHEFVNIQPPTFLRPQPLVTASGAGKDVHTKMKTTKHMTTNKKQKNSLSPPCKQAIPASSRPPPLPPPSVFHNMFRKATKTKEALAPPPTSNSLLSNILKSGVKSKLFHSKPTSSKKVHSNHFNDDGRRTVDVGSNQSPEFPVPPRMKMPEVDFPELENVDMGSTMASDDVREGNQLGGSVFCPSPDVNMKADKFIARLRGEWKLDQINS